MVSRGERQKSEQNRVAVSWIACLCALTTHLYGNTCPRRIKKKNVVHSESSTASQPSISFEANSSHYAQGHKRGEIVGLV
jgi:hypothetical protein